MGGNIGFPRTLKAECVGLIAENRPNGAINPFLLTGVDNCLQVAAVAGNQHHDVFHLFDDHTLFGISGFDIADFPRVFTFFVH